MQGSQCQAAGACAAIGNARVCSGLFKWLRWRQSGNASIYFLYLSEV